MAKRQSYICKYTDCTNQRERGGYCAKHWKKLNDGKPMFPCAFPDCEKEKRKDKYCIKHWNHMNPGKLHRPCKELRRKDFAASTGRKLTPTANFEPVVNARDSTKDALTLQ
ncbi:hypothetical protein N7532_002282 [Penicillium argentinense]|uniref:Uncharacterized protein n=1 Tax=Penicillium argentinense TaxID=1131581 RepID=A0A9W9KLC7_9EURO|nr:uncharacterized protein N7532_002282 [Penicillium argentinense]KAJ5109637.1 hypothetical protein N7532_002282 [Penicillium argentinense]